MSLIYADLPHLFPSPISLSGMLMNPCCKIDGNFSKDFRKYLGQGLGETLKYRKRFISPRRAPLANRPTFLVQAGSPPPAP